MQNTVLNYLDEKNYKAILDTFLELNDIDIAELFQTLYDDELIERDRFILLFRLLPKDAAADVFSYMDSDMQMLLVTSFTDKELQNVINDLYIDDTVDMIEEMPANLVARIIASADSVTRKEINTILRYPKDSAGSLMTTEYVALRRDYTVARAISLIRETGMNKETVYTLYVTQNRKIIGVLSVLDLLTADDDELIENIMDTNVISVDTHEDKEIVADTLSKYDFAAIPVVDKDMRMIGIVTFDDAIDVITEETTEDFEKMAAVGHSDESYFKTSVFTHAKNRILWLMVLMLSATVTGAIISRYDAAFAAVPLLVSFIPMITGTGGNCGSQTSTMVIRGMSLGEIKLKDFFKVMFKELRIALLCGSALSVVNAIRLIITYNNDPSVDAYKLALTVSLAIMATVIMSKAIACMLPMLAKRVKLDPAIMASPLITTIVDICSTMLFFSLATRIFNITV
ncbi:MAG: magnesium transporter [Clostridia bacterium]|nr:magnesium transporter [Clostridia bacterium]